MGIDPAVQSTGAGAARGAADAATLDGALHVLGQTRLFRDWPHDVLHTLAAATTLRRLAARSAVLRPGDLRACLWIVARGGIEVGAFSDTGKKLIIHTGGPGFVYGLLALTRQPSLSQYLVALDATELLALPTAPLRAVLERRPSLWESIATELAYRYRQSLAGITDQLTTTLDTRLSLSLYALARSGAACADRAGGIVLNVSQADLAATLGVTRQSVNRELQNLAAHAVVSLAYGKVIVNDLAGLRRRIQGTNSLSKGEPLVPRPAQS